MIDLRAIALGGYLASSTLAGASDGYLGLAGPGPVPGPSESFSLSWPVDKPLEWLFQTAALAFLTAAIQPRAPGLPPMTPAPAT